LSIACTSSFRFAPIAISLSREKEKGKEGEPFLVRAAAPLSRDSRSCSHGFPEVREDFRASAGRILAIYSNEQNSTRGETQGAVSARNYKLSLVTAKILGRDMRLHGKRLSPELIPHFSENYSPHRQFARFSRNTPMPLPYMNA